MNKDEILKRISGSRLVVLVQPKAAKNEILGWDEAWQALRVAIAAPPEKNRANIELVKFLGRQLGKRAELVAGATSKKKVVAFS